MVDSVIHHLGDAVMGDVEQVSWQMANQWQQIPEPDAVFGKP